MWQSYIDMTLDSAKHRLMADEHEIEINNQTYLYQNGRYLNKVVTYGPGCHFGELALLSDNKLRQATIRCDT